jgi:hypothetical protein
LLAVAEEASSENLKMTASLELVEGNYNKNFILTTQIAGKVISFYAFATDENKNNNKK